MKLYHGTYVDRKKHIFREGIASRADSPHPAYDDINAKLDEYRPVEYDHLPVRSESVYLAASDFQITSFPIIIEINSHELPEDCTAYIGNMQILSEISWAVADSDYEWVSTSDAESSVKKYWEHTEEFDPHSDTITGDAVEYVEVVLGCDVPNEAIIEARHT